MRKKGYSFLLGLLSFILLWWVLSILTANRSLSNPFRTFQRMWELRDVIFLHTGASILRVLVSLFLAMIVGVPLGILLGRSQKINRLLGPLLYFLYPLPKVAFLPIFMLFFGLGNLSKILLIFAVISIQVIVSIRDSVKEISEEYFQVMRNYTTKTSDVLLFLIGPAILPSLLASLRVSVGIALASLFFAENYNTTYGLGYLVLSAWSKMDYEQMLAGITMIALVGFLFFSVLDGLEERICRYR